MNKVLLGAVLVIAVISAAAAQEHRYVTPQGEGVYGFGNFPGVNAYMGERDATIAHDQDPYGTARNLQYSGPSGRHKGSRR
jgi:hypothetical protein